MKIRILEVFVCSCVLILTADAQTPVITSQPKNITVNNASAAAFTVAASNAATFQWFQGPTSLPGATSASLYLDDVSSNQAGNYTVVVRSANNISVTSTPPATLTIVPGTIVQLTISTFPNGSSSNFLVQLFDHDKPATVENFLHYITSGSFSNMFFERDVTNFVLQGGDYITYDRTTNGLNGAPVSTGTNIFPSQLINEYSVGPLIHNRFGTMAMALASGNTNSAASGFFFNLVDNSASLDSQDFTVFGRILSGTNILQYFNTLSAPFRGIYYLDSSVPTLPVNYDGTNYPTDSSLFYCDFAFISPTNPPVDATPPTVSITFPAPNAALTNGGNLTVTGTASDNVGVAEVFCVLDSLSGANNGENLTNTATGTTAWSLDLGSNPPGIYQLTAYAQDGEGNLSAPSTEYFTNLATLTIITNVASQLTTNVQYLVPGQAYSLTAAPLAGEQFLDWQNQGVFSIDPEQEFTAESNLTLTVTYVLSNLPAGLAITYPTAGAVVVATNAEVTVSGTLPSSVTVTQLTVRFFSQSNAVTAPLPVVINGINWSLVVSNLAGGPYTIVAVAEDSAGQEGLVTENFTALSPPIILTQPTNLAVLTGSTAKFSVTASNAVSYQWQLVGVGPVPGATNATLVLPNVGTNMSGSTYEVVLTALDSETVTSTPAVLTVVTGTLVQITFSGFPDGSSSNVLMQLFDHEKPATVANFLHYITPVVEFGLYTNVAYSNMFWDRCLPGFVLQGGDYDATDRTNGNPLVQNESIFSAFTESAYYSPPFPYNIDNEFGVGPVIHNTFGTMAMAKSPGNPDSAANAFFFNLADNSSNLDNQDGGYTVFGQIVSGSNVLQYFNTLRKPNGGIFNSTTEGTNQSMTDLPVNYHGWGPPANSNLFFADFKILSTFNADTNPPTVALNYPANGQTVTNADVVFRGTASDNVAVARVACTFNDNFGFNGGQGTVNANGTTNWTADFKVLPPGTYTFNVAAEDGSGNITSTSNQVIGSFVVPRFPFEASVNGNGILSTNLNGTNTKVGSTYTIIAKPAKGSVFANWVVGTNASLSSTSTFAMQNGLQMTANFISNPFLGGVSITFPVANEAITNANFRINGKVASSFGSAQITCQVFSSSTGNSVSGPMVLTNVSTWITPSVSLSPGNYVVQAIAQGANGRADVVSQPFTVLAQLTVTNYGLGRSSIPNGKYLRVGTVNTIVATPEAGYSFLSWNAGGGSFPNRSITFVMTEGLTLTATYVPKSLPGSFTFTSPANGISLGNANVMLAGKIASSAASPTVLCQLYQNNVPVTGFMPAKVTGTSWTLALTNLTMGGYSATALATDASGNTTLASDTFVLNYYLTIAGYYHGLFFNPASLSVSNAGSVSLILSELGVVYGTLTFPQTNYTLYFQMGPTGSITLGGSPFPFNLTFNFDVTNFSGSMSGSISPGGEVCPLVAYRALTKLSTNTLPSPGNYVLRLPSEPNTDGLLGDGFAAVKATVAGALQVAGTLADNTPFSLSAAVYTNGVWPLYASFYKGQGLLIGWETNLPTGDCTGTLYWIKGRSNGLYYTNGIDEEINSVGSKYVPPTHGAPYQIVFGGGALTSLVTNDFSFNAAGAMIPSAGTTDKLTGSLLSTGVLSKASIVNPFNNEKLSFSGAFFNPTTGGSGFTLDTNKQTGFFTITPIVNTDPSVRNPNIR